MAGTKIVSAQNAGGAQRRQPGAPAPHSGYVVPAPSQSVEIGNFYLRRKEYRGALSRFQEAIHSNPDYAPAYLGLGKVYEKLGDDRRALGAYEKYLDLLPSDKDADNAKHAHRAIERLRRKQTQSGPANKPEPMPRFD